MLPSILEKSIVSSYPYVKDSTTQEKNNFIYALIKLLQIKVSNEEKEEKSRIFFEYVFLECVSSLKGLKLSEIYEAYKMALNGELLLNNERIDIYPELSNITFGKIIQALKIYKQENPEYLNAKAKLLALQAPDQLEAERKENLAQQLDFWQRAYEFCMEVGYHENMHRIYYKLKKEKKIFVSKKVGDEKREQIKEDYKKELLQRKSLLTDNKDHVQVMSMKKDLDTIILNIGTDEDLVTRQRTEAFFVSQWLIENKIDFRSFYKMIYLSEIKDAKEFQTRLSEIYKGCVINQDGTVSKNALKIGEIVTNNGKYTFIEK